MKLTVIILLSAILKLNAQIYSPEKLWGAYSSPFDDESCLNIYENNEWYFTTCASCEIGSIHEKVSEQIYTILDGEYLINNDSIIFANYMGDTCFSMQILDSLNMKIIQANVFFREGDLMIRNSSYIKGHYRGGSIFNEQYTRWIIHKQTDQKGKRHYQLNRYSKPGYIFENREYTVKILPDSIYRQE